MIQSPCRNKAPVRALAVTVTALGLVLTSCSSTTTAGTTGANGPAGSTALPSTGGTVAGASGDGGSLGTKAPVAATTSKGCGTGAAVPAGPSEHTLTSDGVERKYQVIIPARYDGSKPMPIVLGLHALTVSYLIVPGMSGFGDFPNYDFIGVSPSGRLNGPTPYWLAAPSAENYDLDFFNQLLDQLEADYCVDATRVYSVGMSNGAQMSSLLACRLPDRVTAVAPIAGVEWFDTCNGRPIPVIAFHGAMDPIVTYEGGGLNGTTISNQNFWKGQPPAGMPEQHGVDSSMKAWAKHNKCDPEPVEERISPEVRRRTWQHCEADTILYIVDNGGHAWPGKPQPSFEKSFGHGTKDIDASKLLFDFFFTHPNP